MRFEAPTELLARLKLGREEYCQRLLTSLILHGPYPRWNTRSAPAPAGLQFLRALYVDSFGGEWPGDDAVFVDEFELSPRHDAEQGGAPDYAILWDDRVWLIELKTEKASHRASQIPSYFDLAHHHYPVAAVDVLYLTPPMAAPYTAEGPWARYAQATWGDVVSLIRSTWPVGEVPGQQEVIDGLLAAIASLHLKPRKWRAALLGLPEDLGIEPVDPEPLSAGEVTAETDEWSLDTAVQVAALTADDGKQRAVDFVPGDLEDLLSRRLELRNALAAAAAAAAAASSSPLRHVVPWIWRPESTGAPLTTSGQEHGMELRLSRYQSMQY